MSGKGTRSCGEGDYASAMDDDTQEQTPNSKRQKSDDLCAKLTPNDIYAKLTPNNQRKWEEISKQLLLQQQQDGGTDHQPGSAEISVQSSTSMRKDLVDEYILGHNESPVDLLHGELNAIIDEHETGSDCEHNSNAAAPFLCVLQSTGYGKTRAILELAKTKKLVYLVLKSLTNSWQRPKVVTKLLCKLGDAGNDDSLRERRLFRFFSAVKKCVAQEKYSKPADLYTAQISTSPEGFASFGDFYDDLLQYWEQETSTREKKPIRGVLKHTDSSLPSKQDPDEHKSQSGERKVTFNYAGSTRITRDSIVVCFDEVSQLDERSLLAVRRAAKHEGVLSIFADTAASICKVLNPNDHSSTEKGGRLGRFVAPVFSLDTTDLYWKGEGACDDYRNLFCAGRPRWQSHVTTEEGSLDERIQSLIELAANLLTRPRGAEFSQDEKELLKVTNEKGRLDAVDPGMIALFTCRFSLGPHSKMAALLVKHSLATVVGVSEDRSVVCSSYPSEPVLAEASAMYTKEESNLKEVLRNVKAAFHSSNKMLDPPRGDVGEMCAAAILGYAMDYIRQKKSHKYMSEAVELEELLRIFHHSYNRFDDENICGTVEAIVKQWTVNFTHFVRPESVTEHDLEIMWNRRMAYYVPDGVRGLDLLVVIRSNDGNFGTLRVQVKNFTIKISRSECTKFLLKLLPSKCLPKIKTERFSVGLLLSVNGIDERCEILSGPKHQRFRPSQPQEQPQNPVLQLACSFPHQEKSPFKWLSQELIEICSQTTSNARVDIDRFCEGGIQKAIQCVADKARP